mmetsp:Transcript_44208/g.127931  ORF Transcript_44208/g.127931 Transcript_44208/m.127931 type:complete len:386 (+) Transcript_44208:736-1893(+)
MRIDAVVHGKLGHHIVQLEDVVLHAVGREPGHGLDVHQRLHVLGGRYLHDHIVGRRYGVQHAGLAVEEVLREDDDGPDDRVVRGHELELHGALRLVGPQGDVELRVRGDDPLARVPAGALELLQLLEVAVELLAQLLLLAQQLAVGLALLGLRRGGPALLRPRAGGQPAPHVALGRQAHERAPAVQPVVRVQQRGHGRLEVVLAEHLARPLVPHLDLAVLPAGDELRDAVVVQVEAADAVHAVLGLHAPRPRHPLVDPHGPVHQGVGKPGLVDRLHADHDVGLGDLLDNILVVEYSHLEVFCATDKLRDAVIVDITKCKCAHVVPGDCPEELCSFMVKSLDGAVSSHNANWSVDSREITESNHMHTVMYLLEKQVCILLHIVDHE